MAGHLHKSLHVKDTETSKLDLNLYELKILHHNVQSLNNMLLEISISLSFDDISVYVLCFTEYWLRENQLSSAYNDQFKLVSSFSKSSRNGGGSGIFIRNFLHTKDVDYLKGLGSEKNLELSVVELIDLNLILVCIYRSPDGNFYEFLHKL